MKEKFKSILKMNNEYLKIFKIMHIEWLSLIYTILPIIIFSKFLTIDQIVFIEYLTILSSFIIIFDENICNGLMYSKNFHIGIKLYFLINIGLILLLWLINENAKLIAIGLVGSVLFKLNTAYGYIYNEKKKCKTDLLYSFYFITVLIGSLALDPLNNKFQSYWIISSIADIIYGVVEFFVVWKKEDPKILLQTKFNFIKELRALKNAFYVKTGDIIYTNIIELGNLFLITNLEKNFTLFVYIIISRTPIFEISSSMINQIKRIFIENKSINFYKLINYTFLIIMIEALLINTITIFLSSKIKNINYTILFISYILQFFVLFISMRSNFYQLILEFNRNIKILNILKFTSAIFIVICKYFMTNSIYAYIPQIITYGICILFFKKEIRKQHN